MHKRKYKTAYDKKSTLASYVHATLVTVKFRPEEIGWNHKLSCPDRRDPGLISQLWRHVPLRMDRYKYIKLRISPYPPGFPAGFSGKVERSPAPNISPIPPSGWTIASCYKTLPELKIWCRIHCCQILTCCRVHWPPASLRRITLASRKFRMLSQTMLRTV